MRAKDAGRRRRRDAGRVELGDRRRPARRSRSRRGPTRRPRAAARRSTFSSRRRGGDVRVLAGRRAFTLCSSPKTYNGLHARRAHVPGPGATAPTRSSSRSRPTYTWTVADNTAPETTITFGPPAVTGNDRRELHVLERRAARDVRVLAERRGVRAVRLAGRSTPAWRSATTPSRSAPSTPPATPTRRRPPTSGRVVARPETTIDTGPESEIDEHERDVHVLVRPGRLDLRVLARRRPVRRLRLAARGHRPGGRRPHARSSGRGTRTASRTTPGRVRTGRSTRLRRRRRSSPGRRSRRADARARRSPSARTRPA